MSNAEEPDRAIVIVADAPPELMLSGRDEEPVYVRPGDAFVVQTTATDDVGIGALELHLDKAEGETLVLEVEPARLGLPAVTHEFSIPFSALDLKDGDAVTFRLCIFQKPPKFYGVDFHADIEWAGASFRGFRTGGAYRDYRLLRTKMQDLGSHQALDDNDDRGNDYGGFYSANNGTASRHPRLIVTYIEAGS